MNSEPLGMGGLRPIKVYGSKKTSSNFLIVKKYMDFCKNLKVDVVNQKKPLPEQAEAFFIHIKECPQRIPLLWK